MGFDEKSPWRWAMKRNQCNRGINREKLTEKKWKMSFKWRSTINLSPIEIGGEKQWYMSCCCCWWGSVGEMYTGSTSRLHAMYTLPITSSNHYFYYGDLYCLNLSIVTWTCKGPLSQKHCPFFGGGPLCTRQWWRNERFEYLGTCHMTYANFHIRPSQTNCLFNSTINKMY